MGHSKLMAVLERSPVIAAVRDDGFAPALVSPCEVIFYLKANINTLPQRCEAARACHKLLFVHIDLAEGLGKDKSAVEFLASLGVDGIVSTRGNMIRWARECGLMTVQRFFALDSLGIIAIDEMLESVKPDMMELMPGVIPKLIRRFSEGRIPVIAGGLVQTKSEVTEALSAGAAAVSTGTQPLWHI